MAPMAVFCVVAVFFLRKTHSDAGARETRRTRRLVSERHSIAVFFKGADTNCLYRVLGLDSQIQPRVSQYDFSHGNSVNGS